MFLVNVGRVLRRKMDFGFGDLLYPNIAGLRQFFENDSIIGYVMD